MTAKGTRSPNETARENHNALFLGHVSTLAVTDPELIESPRGPEADRGRSDGEEALCLSAGLWIFS
jgi:hypothetical protein